jgi:hypothetical protein
MIRVLIERRIAEGLEHYYDCTIMRTVSTVTKAPGCISGESLKDSKNSNRRIVMSEITPMLEGPEKITMLELTT